jgi:hypothetical protein
MHNIYQHGKIYIIESKQTNKVYIGSTTQPLSKRLIAHKRDYNNYIDGKYHYVTSFDIVKYEDAYIKLLKEYPCDCRAKLHKKESKYIRKYLKKGRCVNKRIEGRTSKQYRLDNIEHVKKRKAKYYLKNKEKIKEKEREIIKCECGIEVKRGGISQHKKSNKHKICLESGIEGWEQYKKDESKRLKKLRIERNKEKNYAYKRELQKNCPIITCGCGKSFKSNSKNRHCKSKFHQKWLLSQ